MISSRVPYSGRVHVQIVLSPFEQEVAVLARAGYGRNGVAAALGISPGTVKVVLRQIRWKLGEDWRENPRFIWPEQYSFQPAATGEDSKDLFPLPEDIAAGVKKEHVEVKSGFVDTFEPNNIESIRRAESWDGRRLAAGLILQSGPNKTLLKVSGLQRFWLKPALSDLEFARHLRLLAADKNDVFSPPWLPIVGRRRQVRAAVYLARNEVQVRSCLEDYINSGLWHRINEVLEHLAEARGLTGRWRRVNLPDATEIRSLVHEAFGPTAQNRNSDTHI